MILNEFAFSASSVTLPGAQCHSYPNKLLCRSSLSVIGSTTSGARTKCQNNNRFLSFASMSIGGTLTSTASGLEGSRSENLGTQG